MKKITLLMLTAFMSALFAGGFGTSSNEEVKKLKAPDGKEYEVIIGTALEEGSYYQGGKTLAYLIGKDKKRKDIAYVATTDGCGQNLNLLKDGVINVAFCQGDMVAARKASDKNYLLERTAIKLDRKENVQLVMRKGMDEDDLQKKGAKVLVGLPNSGGAGSWDNIIQLEPDYGLADVEYGDIDDTALMNLEDGTIDAIIRTSHLNPKTDDFAKQVSKNKKIYFADFDDKDLNDSIDLGNGERPIYAFDKTEISKGFFNDIEAYTLTTNVYLIINKNQMSKKTRNKIIRAAKKKLF